jgi:hypothetical protein
MVYWIQATLPILSLIISALALYFTNFWQSDRLDVYVSKPSCCTGGFQLKLSDMNQFVGLEFSDEEYMTFVNSGNRAAAISGIGVEIFPTTFSNKNPRICDEEHESSGTTYDIAPFSIKPGDIITTKAIIKGGVGSDLPSLYVGSEAKRVLPTDTIHLSVCIHFDVISPASPIRRVNALLESSDGRLNDRVASYRSVSPFTIIDTNVRLEEVKHLLHIE